MPNILEDLYYGNPSPSHRVVRPDSRVKKLMQKQSDLESKLNESFTEEQRAKGGVFINVFMYDNSHGFPWLCAYSIIESASNMLITAYPSERSAGHAVRIQLPLPRPSWFRHLHSNRR